jgi:triosephosphate isomerase
MINKKIKAALSANLKVILCVGETLEEKKSGGTEKVIESQIKNGLEGIIGKGPLSDLILAYEPVWAIGTGKACGIPEARAVNLFIRKIIKNSPIIYGGSINSQNANDFIKKAEFQGFIIGSVSLDPEEFTKLVKNIDLIS